MTTTTASAGATTTTPPIIIMNTIIPENTSAGRDGNGEFDADTQVIKN